MVSPNTLVVAIRNIRKHIQETNATIETVHRRGYIFHQGEELCHVIDSDDVSRYKDVNINRETPKVNEDFRTDLCTSTKECVGIDSLIISPFPARIKSLLKDITYFVIFFVALWWSIFINTSTQDLYCYQFENASVCGVFSISEEQKQTIEAQVKGLSGDFLYAFEKEFSEIKVYKNN